MIPSVYSEFYFDWMCRYITVNEKESNYTQLLSLLNDITFEVIIPRDDNRKQDGYSLRNKFAWVNGYDYDTINNDITDEPSILEVLLALAIRAEETITSNVDDGDKTHVWFWEMMNNMHLTDYDDDHFDRDAVIYICQKFLTRDYEPNGDGGPFRFSETDRDMRTVELWYQMQWYSRKFINF